MVSKTFLGLTFLKLAITTCAFSAEGKIIKMTTLNWEPYYGENLKNQGVITELVNESFKRVGLRTTIEFMPWQRAMILVESGQYDILMGAYHTKDREKKFFISDPIYNVKIRIVAHKDSKIRNYKSLVDLKGFKIGVSQGFANREDFDKADYLIKDVAKSPLLNIRKLLTRRVDMIVISEEILLHRLNKFKVRDRPPLVYIDPILNESSLHLLSSKVRKSNSRIIEDFNTGIREIKKDGTYLAILKKFGFRGI
ncbi:substrate-binding periplasmic protein [Pseudobacteriovorax antillogorgiicola]|uniref:Amino acid ABC transporter substrate-binding protein, PAAT family n=1 Tax=Pseudobacteriovorax antillogorgiicola TaxID=1513793 RepID=A0A1Y6CGH2_9BACT|nr:transporter substrate-binding domain-containing protein [Pseudobacteriovorax antillogorgiicola]TCS47592.1 amino acid ABC transporter substrate-binding protein (PAAT family) [Pseudobacteriovorax antillogorgiicola]SMF60215.1 amino acid ABC transporter substrate-binding protein, PAAT family [Pseudobacteriovorax antillogorgiicola]